MVPYYNGPPFSGSSALLDMATFSMGQVLDVSAADVDAEGCRGGSHDATYGYLMDHHNGAYQGKVARFDLATSSVVQVLGVAETDASLKTFYGGFQDCTYGFQYCFTLAEGVWQGLGHRDRSTSRPFSAIFWAAAGLHFNGALDAGFSADFGRTSNNKGADGRVTLAKFYAPYHAHGHMHFLRARPI